MVVASPTVSNVPVVPDVAKEAVAAITKAAPSIIPEQKRSEIGQAFGSALGDSIRAASESLGAGVDKSSTVLSSTVDKTGDVLSKTADKTSDLAGAALDRTIGKDKTVVQGLDEFGHTRVGLVTLVVTSWKLLGKEASELLKVITGIAVGVPIQVVLILLYIWVMRRFFVTRSVVIKKTGGLFSKERVVEYGLINVVGNYKNTEGVKVISSIDEDTKHAGLFLTSVIFLIVSILNVAQVIF